MSNIFAALEKNETELAHLVLPLVTEKPVARAAAPSTALNYSVPSEKHANPIAPEPGQSFFQAARSVEMKLSVKAPVFPFDGSNGKAAEQYRMVRTRILQDSRKPRLIALTSAGPGDGKTVTSVNIAACLSLNNEGSVCLIDGDLRRSKIASILGIDPKPGLAEVLSGECGLDEAIVNLQQVSNLNVLPAGTNGSHAAELLQSPRMAEVCAALRSKFLFTIFDTPPIASVADYNLIEAKVDGVIVVVRPDHTRRTACLQTLKAIPKDKMLGVVLNQLENWILAPVHDYYSYYS